MSERGTMQDAVLSERTPGEKTIAPPRETVGILVEDPTYRRLIEGIARHLDLTPKILTADDLRSDTVLQFELIVADADAARSMRPLIAAKEVDGEGIKPALIAVTEPVAVPTDETSELFDAVLARTENPATLTAKLGVALYAHRAFARRYQTALEELSLNRNIFKSVTSGISVANAQLPDLPLMYVNPAFEVMTGYSLEDVEGKNCRFLQRGEGDQPGVTLIREALAGGRETIAVIRNYRKDGSAFWNQLSLSPIRNREGVLTHFVGIQMDVTERVEFEIALRESEKLAAVGRLASSIAHEINNPLEAVMNLVYLAQQVLPVHEDSEEARSYMRQADQELQRIKLITVQSLRFYKQSNQPEAVTCAELLRPILDIYAPRFTNYNITLQVRERSTQHLVCLASEVRQVLSNLISNAVDAMKDGGGVLRVRTREATDGTTQRVGILLTIADRGKGMNAETVANMYKAFYTTKGVSGTGLGLWISSEIVQRHRGHMGVRSRQGVGTVFELFLPFQAVAGEE